MVTKNNNSNAIHTADRQSLNNRDMVGTTTPRQTFFSMDLNPEKRIQWESRKIHSLIKILSLSKSIPGVPLTGRLKNNTGS